MFVTQGNNGLIQRERGNTPLTTGISEPPLPSPPRKFPSFEGGGPMVLRLFYCLLFRRDVCFAALARRTIRT